MSGTLVLGAAPAPDPDRTYERLIAEASAVVAADAAGEWCVGLGRVPDLVVGDFDSASPGAAERLTAAGARIIAFPADKDDTDLDLALEAALERFGGPVTVAAAFTGRLDHTLAALGTVLRAGAHARVVEPGWRAHAVHPDAPVTLALPAGTPFGLVAPGGACGVTVDGGRWRLDREDLAPLGGRAISNAAAAPEVSVSCRDGALLLIVFG